MALAFLRLTCLHVSVLCHLWSTVECRLRSLFSSPSLGEGCRQKCQLVPVATPLTSLVKQTQTVIMSLQKRTASASQGAGHKGVGKKIHQVLTPWEHRGKDIYVKASVLPAQVNLVTQGELLVCTKCFQKHVRQYRASIPEKLSYSQFL